MVGIAWSDNSLCLGCHQDESLKKQDARGKSISLFVSGAVFKSSVHGKLSCSMELFKVSTRPLRIGRERRKAGDGS